MRGISPSKIKTKASAARRECQKDTYFLAGCAAWDAPLPRMALKKSEPLGSKTMTSLFLEKLAL
jgi:hypothetical protein